MSFYKAQPPQVLNFKACTGCLALVSSRLVTANLSMVYLDQLNGVGSCLFTFLCALTLCGVYRLLRLFVYTVYTTQCTESHVA